MYIDMSLIKERKIIMKNNEKLIPVCIYCDSTGLFSETECNVDNLTDMLFPGSIINEWYKENEKVLAPECKAEGYKPNAYNWYTEVYTADDTIGLYDFAVAKGYDPVFEMPDHTQNAVVYENLEYDTVVAFKGTTMECRKWAKANNWKIKVGHSDTEVDLEILFHELKRR